jgi:hypothetical protein
MSDIKNFERNKYFYGKLMTVRDFETEQSYFNEKRHMLNQLIHGIGIVCGLEVEDSNANDETKRPKIVNGKWNVYLHSGVGLDCCGREIVVDRNGFVEVTGTFKDGLNYLYLRYKECEKESVPVLANASTCEEACCYNRVEEVFELELGDSPDKDMEGVSGMVTESDETTPISGALVEALQNEIVKGVTITNDDGDYTFMLSPDTYDIRASASGYKSEVKTNVSVPSPVNFLLGKETDPKSPKELWEDVPNEYYKEHLKLCPECEDAKVLLAVINKSDAGLRIDNVETYKYRAIVYNNHMLYDLLSSHLIDFNNPHRVTAAGAVEPATMVTSVGKVTDVGTSIKYAREDHVHNLADDIQNQLNTVFQYMRERALKCTVVNFREVANRFGEQYQVYQRALDFSQDVKKLIDAEVYEDERRFEGAISDLDRELRFFLEDQELIRKATDGSLEDFQKSLDNLSAARATQGSHRSLKIATALDEVCFYALMLERELV